VTAGLLVAHHRRPQLMRIEIITGLVQDALGISFQDPVAEALADETPLAVSTVRVEAVADDPATIAFDIGHDCDEARGHFGEVDIGVSDGGCDRLGDLADLDNAHDALLDLVYALNEIRWFLKRKFDGSGATPEARRETGEVAYLAGKAARRLLGPGVLRGNLKASATGDSPVTRISSASRSCRSPSARLVGRPASHLRTSI
jgi:hypothetical protein